MKYAVLLTAVLGFNSAFADHGIWLEPGESRYVNGTQVTCNGQGGGHGNSTRTFQCSVVNSSYPSLDNNLTVRSQSFDGSLSVDNLFKFNRQSDCNQAASSLNRVCATGYSCSVLFCEADNSSYPSLDNTLYQVKNQGGSQLSVVAVQRFRFQTECRQNAP